MTIELEHSLLLLQLNAMMPPKMAEYTAKWITALSNSPTVLFVVAFREMQNTAAQSATWLPKDFARYTKPRQIAVVTGSDIYRATDHAEHRIVWSSVRGLLADHIPTEWWHDVDDQVS